MGWGLGSRAYGLKLKLSEVSVEPACMGLGQIKGSELRFEVVGLRVGRVFDDD